MKLLPNSELFDQHFSETRYGKEILTENELQLATQFVPTRLQEFCTGFTTTGSDGFVTSDMGALRKATVILEKNPFDNTSNELLIIHT